MGIETFASSDIAAQLLGELLHGQRRWGVTAMGRLADAFLRDDGRRPPQQNCAICIPGLETRPWFSTGSLEVARRLEAAWPQLSEELCRAAREANFTHYQQDNDAFLDLENWSTADLIVHGRIHPNHRLATGTLKLLLDCAEPAEMITLSRLAGGGHIKPHCGPWNTRLTVHFGIETPANCRMRVGDTWRTWHAGECLVFDDSFEHECLNSGRDDRTVLLFDIWHPDLTRVELTVLKSMVAILQRDHWCRRTGDRSEPMDAFETFVIVANAEEQYSLWPAELTVPEGWRTVTEAASREASLAWVRAHWHDMRPLSARR